jgi:hypothetical protein
VIVSSPSSDTFIVDNPTEDRRPAGISGHRVASSRRAKGPPPTGNSRSDRRASCSASDASPPGISTGSSRTRGGEGATVTAPEPEAGVVVRAFDESWEPTGRRDLDRMWRCQAYSRLHVPQLGGQGLGGGVTALRSPLHAHICPDWRRTSREPVT